LYGCECWGFSNNHILKKVQLKFLKSVLNVKSSTPNCMLYEETGVKPLQIDIDTRIVTYWAKLVAPTYDKLSVLMYKSMLSRLMKVNITNANSFKWICYVRTVLIKCDLVNIWTTSHFLKNLFSETPYLIDSAKHLAILVKGHKRIISVKCKKIWQSSGGVILRFCQPWF